MKRAIDLCAPNLSTASKYVSHGVFSSKSKKSRNLMKGQVVLLICSIALCSCRSEDSVSISNQTESEVSIRNIQRSERTMFRGDEIVLPRKSSGRRRIGSYDSNNILFKIYVNEEEKEYEIACELRFDDDPATGCAYIAWLVKEESYQINCVCQPMDSN